MRLIAFAACLLLTSPAWAQGEAASAPADEIQTLWRVDVSSVGSSAAREGRSRSVRYGEDWASWVFRLLKLLRRMLDLAFLHDA